jgi:hypothetical protein
MKKKYQIPIIKLVDLRVRHQLLAGSLNINSSDSSVDASEASARRSNSFWDNDEE